MSDVRLLVVSPPCIEVVNRAVYRVMARDHGIALHLVVPDRLPVEGRWKDCLPIGDEPFETTKLSLVGGHPRLRTLAGLEKLIADWKPTHVLLDGDPAQRLTRQASAAVRRVNGRRSEVWVLTAENMRPDYVGDLWTGVKSLRPATVAGVFVVGWLRAGMERHVDHVFTLSRDGRSAMEASGFAGRAHQIPLGFDPGLFQAQPAQKIAATRARLGLREKTFAYFGRLIPQKGLHLLVEALATLRDEKWQLLLDRFSEHGGPYADQIQHQIETLGLGERVVFFSARHDEMPDYVNAADFVVLPSISIPKWKEQYGRVLVEGMACGKVVMGSRSGAIPEVIGDCGLLFPEGDVAALAATLRHALALPESERQGIANRALARAHAEFSIQRQAAIWVRLLRAGQN